MNYFRTTFIPWQKIKAFDLRPWSSIYWTPFGVVDLNDGSSVPILGIGRSSPRLWPKRAPAEDMIDELNRILESHRTDV